MTTTRRPLTSADFTTRGSHFVQKRSRRVRRELGVWLFMAVVGVVGLLRGLSRKDIRRMLFEE